MLKTDVIYQGDCISGLREEILDESIDLIVTDPPYLMSYKSNRRKDKNHKFCTEIAGDNDEDLIKDYIAECYRILKPNSAMYMFCNSNKVDFLRWNLRNSLL